MRRTGTPLSFGTNAVTSVCLRYLGTNDASFNPDGQRMGVSNLFFDVPVDVGDAPDTGSGTGTGNYQTLRSDNGPRHLLVGYHSVARTTSLMLGATVDDEANGQPNAAVIGDDLAGVDDENGVASFPVLDTSATSYAIPAARVAVMNSNGAAATLYGFIDFNSDGDFADSGESTAAVVPERRDEPFKCTCLERLHDPSDGRPHGDPLATEHLGGTHGNGRRLER
jgi:hypothetical protein